MDWGGGGQGEGDMSAMTSGLAESRWCGGQQK